jgi:glycosyltransferase involved in cell wall biosynthesis
VFVGSMDYHANIDAALYFAKEAWPGIRMRRPDISLLIVGSRPVPEITALGKQDGITVTGTVEDVRPYYHGALASIVPLRVGGGTRLKVLEAMAAGTPVISTKLGAEGLSVTDGKELLIADSPAAMVDAVASLQDESTLWGNLVANARKLVREQYDWSVIGDKLVRLHEAQANTAREAEENGAHRQLSQ